MMHTISLDATWEEHVKAFMDECLMTYTQAEDYTGALAGMGLIRPSDRLVQFEGAGIPDGAIL